MAPPISMAFDKMPEGVPKDLPRTISLTRYLPQTLQVHSKKSELRVHAFFERCDPFASSRQIPRRNVPIKLDANRLSHRLLEPRYDSLMQPIAIFVLKPNGKVRPHRLLIPAVCEYRPFEFKGDESKHRIVREMIGTRRVV